MIITIEGPTAAGKTAIALMLAEALNTRIVNCDSRQVYRYMDIGTAKPSKEELARVQHHLIDIIDPGQIYNAGLFVKDAAKFIASLQKENKIPIICGGTGLYVRSLLEGLFEHPPIDSAIRVALKAELESLGVSVLYQRLQAIDPDFAKRISENDPQRILRGLEIYAATGLSISEHWKRQKRVPRYRAMRILVSPARAILYERINKRVEDMLSAGLVSEIEALICRGYTWQDPGLNTLGYKEFKDFFEGKSELHVCAELVAQHHRNYAKRQLTWYRKCRFDLTFGLQSFSLSDVLGEIETRYMRYKEETGAHHSQDSKT